MIRKVQPKIPTRYINKVVGITVAEHYVHKGMYCIKALGITLDRKGYLRWKLLGNQTMGRNAWTLEKTVMHICLCNSLMYVSQGKRGGRLLPHHITVLNSVKPIDMDVYDTLLNTTIKERKL